MEVGKLNVKARHNTGKGVARKLRAQGLVPGICYGVSMEGTLPVTVDPKALKASLDPARGQNTLITCTVEDNGTTRDLTVMLRDYQIDPIRREVTHVDLVAIDPNAEVDVDVPVEFTGKAIGLVSKGTLHVVRHEVSVRCRPADIPNKFEVDITNLDIGDNLHVSDMQFPEGVRPVPQTEKLTLITCNPPEAEAEPAEGAAAAEAKPAAGKAAAKAEDKKSEGKK